MTEAKLWIIWQFEYKTAPTKINLLVQKQKTDGFFGDLTTQSLEQIVKTK